MRKNPDVCLSDNNVQILLISSRLNDITNSSALDHVRKLRFSSTSDIYKQIVLILSCLSDSA